MDTYAIALYFDDTANTKLNKAIKDVADVTNNMYMLETVIPPHITIASFNSDNEEKIEGIVGDFAKHIKRSEIIFEEIRSFEPKVLFVSPRKDDCLSNLNTAINRLLLEEFLPADNGNYLPEKWIPHCALIVKSDEVQLQKSQTVAKKMMLPFVAEISKIVLAKCDPYKEIRVWEIER